MRRRILVRAAAVGLAGLAVGLGTASAAPAGRVFYLAVHARQCLEVPTSGGSKMVPVVPCSNPAHNLEVYAVGHGGWGHAGPPAYAKAYAVARSICLSSFLRITGRPLGSREGWNASWPDPGAESARYGDKVVCEYRTWPTIRALGRGWHVK